MMLADLMRNRQQPKTASRARRIGAAVLAAACLIGWTAPVAADPPAWAPAHGYRAKHKQKYKHDYARYDRRYDRQYAAIPSDIGIGRCNRELLGGLLGAAGGGLAGAQIGDGRGQLAAVAAGTVLGYLLGSNIGRSMDQVDAACVARALEHADDGQDIVWDNPTQAARYEVTPTRTYQRGDGRYCREYTSSAIVNGREQTVYGTACRQPDGSWELQS
jgi:surface antigen